MCHPPLSFHAQGHAQRLWGGYMEGHKQAALAVMVITEKTRVGLIA